MNTPYILLINPCIYDFAAYDLWIKPVGLLCIAQVLKKNGLNVHLIDCLDIQHPAIKQNRLKPPPIRKKTDQGHFYKKEIPKPAVLQNIKRKYRQYGIHPSFFEHELASLPKPQAVLVTSMMTYWYPGVIETIRWIRTLYPDVPIVLGGVYATLCSDHAQVFSGADYVFSGSCNQQFLNVIAAITGKSITVPDDEFILPDCSFMSSHKSIPLLSSRGCPLRCSYCASFRLHPSFTQCDPLRIVNEIEYWVMHKNSEDFVFYDDALLIHPQKLIIPLLQELLQRRISVRFHLPNGLHIRNINYGIAELMKKTGFYTLRLGLETIDPQFQKISSHKVTKTAFTRAAAILKEVGFSKDEIGVYVLAGLPGQTAASVYATIRFVQEHDLRPFIAEYSPIPGTALWDEAVKFSQFPLIEEPLYHNNTLLPCQWDNFTLHDLDNLKKTTRD